MLINRVRHISSWLIVTLVLLLTFTLAACGTNASTTSTTTGGAPASTPKPAPTATHQGQASTTGCPNNAVITTQPAAANVVLKNAGINTTVTTVKKGETIEVNLPFGHAWAALPNAQGLLVAQNPSGYASPTAQVCVWRFVATNTGKTELSFSGRPICKQGQLCPQYIMAVSFTIDIQ